MKYPQRILGFIILIAVIVLVFSQGLVHLLTESWWFDAVGFADVFWTRINWKVTMWIVTFALYAAFLGGNYWLAMHFTRNRVFRALLESDRLGSSVEDVPNYVAAGLTVAISLLAAGSGAAEWETILKFFNPTEFGITDPIYQRDVGFYVFQLPFYEILQGRLLALCIWGIVLAATVYALKGEITLGRGWRNIVVGTPKIHLSLILAAIAVLVAVGFWLERYDLLYSSSGVVYGAGFTDVHARLQSYWFMGFATLALMLVFLISLWRSGFALPTFGIGIYAIVLILVSGIYPWFQQQFIVAPNELEKEKPYIANNIEFTRAAYRLDTVSMKDYAVQNQLDSTTLDNNQLTLSNIRLWDYRPLLSTYRQLQEIRLYYRFLDVDVDRYTIDGNYQQVMLSPRELDYAQLPSEAQRWVNQRLQYTHGYGIVMSPVNEVTPDGLPDFYIQDIPPVSTVDLEVTQPGIYYGEKTDNYVFTNTTIPEFDYPRSGENAQTRYEGEGGVPVGSFLKQIAYAYDLGSLKLLISDYLTRDSQILYHRLIRERVQQVAPFLKYDNDPYITTIDGRLNWIIDAYTVSDRYPYSAPVNQSDGVGDLLQGRSVSQILRGGDNYIRNSVKVVIDAYDGTMQFFVVDETDPVLRTYQKIFPDLFAANDTIPSEIKAHFRYPVDLFKIQAQVYLSYHMQEPEEFYNREDLWRFPTELYEDQQILMQPYYIIMRLPDETQEEFMLILPFTPVNKDNMIAWMAARSDGDDYGKLLLYEFPKQELIYGPSQIEARINQNPEISQQLTLWSQEGSRVIRGDLLVIPVEQSLLYVEPIYLRAEQGELPELRRVIVSYADQVVMEQSLEDALAVIFGESSSQQDEQVRPLGTATVAPSVVQSALEAYQNAQEALREGDWSGYGQYQSELGRLLDQLNQGSGDLTPDEPASPE
ncbi:MAG: UPF0182 family protein [Elainellaceae cyanobacterium]